MSQHPIQLAYAANAKGERFGIRCRYEFDTSSKLFVWKFYRRGVYLGKTSKPDQVLTKLDKFCTSK